MAYKYKIMKANSATIFRKYLGHVEIDLKQSGNRYIIADKSQVVGSPIMLDDSIAQDPEARDQNLITDYSFLYMFRILNPEVSIG